MINESFWSFWQYSGTICEQLPARNEKVKLRNNHNNTADQKVAITALLSESACEILIYKILEHFPSFCRTNMWLLI